MPVTQTQTYYDEIDITAEPVKNPSPVLWTDDEPTIEVGFADHGDTKWSDETTVRLHIQIDGDQIWNKKITLGPIEPDESKSVRVDAPPLTYEGHAIVGVSIRGGRNVNNEKHPSALQAGRSGSDPDPTAAFSVWDESHYEATVRRPKQLQKGIILTSVVLVLFAALQIYLVL